MYEQRFILRIVLKLKAWKSLTNLTVFQDFKSALEEYNNKIWIDQN